MPLARAAARRRPSNAASPAVHTTALAAAAQPVKAEKPKKAAGDKPKKAAAAKPKKAAADKPKKAAADKPKRAAKVNQSADPESAL